MTPDDSSGNLHSNCRFTTARSSSMQAELFAVVQRHPAHAFVAGRDRGSPGPFLQRGINIVPHGHVPTASLVLAGA